MMSLLRANGGLSAFNVSYMIPYLEFVVDRMGSVAHLITGNGGALLRDLRPPHPLSSQPSLSTLDDLLHTLVYNVSRKWLPPETASAIVGLPQSTLMSSIRTRLSDYPESSLNGLYLHFSFERLYKYSFEGEDRNRSYLWSSAPYHGLHFTRYALNCPDEQKENYRLYRILLHTLSPKNLQIGYGNFYGFRMTAPQYNLYRFFRWAVRKMSSLRSLLNQRRGRIDFYSGSELTPRLLKHTVENRDIDFLDKASVIRLLGDPGAHTARSIDNLLTTVLVLCAGDSLPSQ